MTEQEEPITQYAYEIGGVRYFTPNEEFAKSRAQSMDGDSYMEYVYGDVPTEEDVEREVTITKYLFNS